MVISHCSLVNSHSSLTVEIFERGFIGRLRVASRTSGAQGLAPLPDILHQTLALGAAIQTKSSVSGTQEK